MLGWVLNTIPARNISSFFSNIWYHFEYKILNVQFRMLPQQLSANLIFVKRSLLFYLKYIYETSRIWDTLPTSKMELFMTIGIYKVIFCRLTILYTHYCSMSVFICVNSLSALFCSRWFNLQASEMVLFATVTIANVVFY